MLRNENMVRYVVLEITDGVITPWFCTCREKIKEIIVEAERKNAVIKIIRYYPNNIAYDSVLRPNYSSEHERNMIFHRK